jgi:predicted phage terminase large subunit-like protein
MFCSSTANVAIFGGAAYGGKSVALLLEAAGCVQDERYRGIIFRRKYNEIVDGGGLWDTSEQIYPVLGGMGVRGKTEWSWKTGARVKFNHLNQDENVYDYMGSAFVFIGFDELTHFSRHQFLYMLTRNRPPAGCTLRPYCRATCNPDADSWVAGMISWWINPKTGYPIPERSGVVRFFTIEDEKIIWVSPNWRDIHGMPAKSFTFIYSDIESNPLGVAADPTYRSNLLTQDKVTRERLLKGNWLISWAGNMFASDWFGSIEREDLPPGMRLVRYWDFAASEVRDKDKNDPDWTAGALCGIHNGILYIVDITSFREKPGTTERIIREVAEADGAETEVWWEEEKGSAGKYASEYMRKIFEGFETHPDPVSGNKIERAKPWAAWAEFGRVKLVRGEWNKQFLTRCGKFPEGKRDEVDGVSGSFRALVGEKKVLTRYIPNENGHLRPFKRAKEDFEKISVQNLEVYVSLWATADGGVYGGFYSYSLVNKRLRLFNEIFFTQVTAPELAMAITEKVIVPLESKMGYVTVKRIYGNKAFFNIQKESLQKEIKAYGIRVRQNMVYDELASISRVNRMFAQSQIVIHSDCVESDIQIRGWSYVDALPKEGYPLARALCLLVSEMKSDGVFYDPGPQKAYSYPKQKQRQDMLAAAKSQQAPVLSVNPNRQHDWLVDQ